MRELSSKSRVLLVKTDFICLATALASGLPNSYITTRASIRDSPALTKFSSMLHHFKEKATSFNFFSLMLISSTEAPVKVKAIPA